MAGKKKMKRSGFSEDRFSTVELQSSNNNTPLELAAGLMALDHLLMQLAGRHQEDEDIRAQLDAVNSGDLTVPLAGLIDPGPEAWDMKALQRAVQDAYSAFALYTEGGPGEDGWSLAIQEEVEDHPSWTLLEKIAADGNTYVLRFEGIINANAGKIAHAMRDVEPQSRCYWDHADLKPLYLRMGPRPQDIMVLPAVRRRGPRLIRPYQSKAKQARAVQRGRIAMDRSLEIVETYIHPPTIGGVPVPGVATRRLLGVQWGMYDPKKREYILLMPTIEDVPKDPALFGCPAGCVDVSGFTGMRLVADGLECTRATMVIAINPNGRIPGNVMSWGHGKFMERVMLIERVCSEPFFSRLYGNPTEKK